MTAFRAHYTSVSEHTEVSTDPILADCEVLKNELGELVLEIHSPDANQQAPEIKDYQLEQFYALR